MRIVPTGAAKLLRLDLRSILGKIEVGDGGLPLVALDNDGEGRGSTFSCRPADPAGPDHPPIDVARYHKLHGAADALIIVAGFGPRNGDGATILLEKKRLCCFAWEVGRHDEAVLLAAGNGNDGCEITGHELLEEIDAFHRRREAFGDGKAPKARRWK